MIFRIALFIVAVFFIGNSAVAQPKPAATQPATAASKLSDKLSVTEHHLKAGKIDVKYKATTGLFPFKDETGKEKANFFFVAYEKDRPEGSDVKDRPITFVFNGGPGAAAIWLHIGTAGPRRVSLSEEGFVVAPPYRGVDNEFSWLAATDLVFIDPIGTGYSRPAAGEKGDQFYGVREDVTSVAEFIRLYLSKYERWASPKFLAGESYGTTRAAGLAQHLVDRHGIAVNGIILISTVLNFATIQPNEGNDLPYPLFLPTYTASAWHYKKLSTELQSDLGKTLAEAKQFAANEYTTALAKGASLPADERKAIVAKMSRLTSLTEEYLDRSEMRVSPSEFRKQLLASEKQIIGRFDSRNAGYDPQLTDNNPEYDPSTPMYIAVYSGVFNDYIRRTLRFESELNYEALSNKVHPWNYGPAGNGHLNVAPELRAAIIRNPHLRVMFCSGYFDLATPFFATDYTVDHMKLSKELRGNIVQTYYMGGHMMYHNRPALSQLQGDVSAFIEGKTK